jgi:hypothetical protein
MCALCLDENINVELLVTGYIILSGIWLANNCRSGRKRDDAHRQA